MHKIKYLIEKKSQKLFFNSGYWAVSITLLRIKPLYTQKLLCACNLHFFPAADVHVVVLLVLLVLVLINVVAPEGVAVLVELDLRALRTCG